MGVKGSAGCQSGGALFFQSKALDCLEFCSRGLKFAREFLLSILLGGLYGIHVSQVSFCYIGTSPQVRIKWVDYI